MDHATAALTVKVSRHDRIGVLTLSDPATLNAATDQMLQAMRAGLDDLAADDAIRCVIITGEGRGFCSGANLSSGGPTAPGGDAWDVGALLENAVNPMMLLLRDYPKPTVAAVNGPAAGVGASFALVCDLIVAAESGYFLQAFRRIGLVPDGGATWMLPRTLGKARAMELVLLGEKLSARQALEWGLINRCVPDAELMSTAMQLARALADGPKSLAYMRKMIWDGMGASFPDQLQCERIMQREAGATEDCREGIEAFVEKRPAKFKGR